MQAQRHSEKYYGLQVLRFVAAILVVGTHAWASLQRDLRLTSGLPVLDNGVLGVDIFFGISGVVLYLSAHHLLRSTGGGFTVAREFYRRRFLRVAPSYYLLTILKLVIFLVAPASIVFFRPHCLNTLASFLFVTRFHGDAISLPVLAIGWTLCYEMLFYLVLAASLWRRVALLPGAACVLGAFAVAGYIFPSVDGFFRFVCNPIVLEFLGGMAIAAMLPTVRRIPRSVAIALLAGAFWYGLAVVHGSAARSLTDLHVRVYALPGLLIVLAVVALEGHVPFQRMRMLLLLGDASYALYLTHQFVEPPMVRLVVHLAREQTQLRELTNLAGVSAVLITCCVVAVLYHLWLENPLTRLVLKKLPWSMTEAAETPTLP